MDRLVREVRACMDENMDSAALVSEDNVDTLSLDEIVRDKIVEAVGLVHLAAPPHMLEEGHSFGDSVTWEGDGAGWTPLPDDFLRLVSFKMSDWDRAVYTAVAGTDPEYELQRQRVPGLRGTPQKPVAAVVNRPEGKVLEFFSCRSESAYAQFAQYVPRPAVEDNSIDVSERCREAVVYLAASLAASTTGDSERAAFLRQECERRIS